MKKLNIIKLPIIIILIISGVFAQNLYFEGVGESTDLEEAHKNALANLSESIHVSINSLFNRVITEENLNITKDFTQNQVKSYSAISLRNVEFIEIKNRKIWNVKARVLKYEVEKIFLERKSEIRTLIRTGKQAEKTGDISEALKNYYWSYLVACSIPDTVYTFFLEEAIQGNARTILIPKIESIIKQINFDILQSYSEEGEFVVKLDVTYKQEPVNMLYISYYDGKYQDWVEVNDGRCYITQSGDFSTNKIALNVIVEYQFVEEMEQNQTVYQISKGLNIPPIDNNLTLEIDLSEYINFDFAMIERSKKCYYFNPKLENLSVSSIKWEFGDGKSSKIMNPIHTYSVLKNYNISMILNNNEDLRINKKLILADDIHTVAPPKPNNAEPEIDMTDGKDITKSVGTDFDQGIIEELKQINELSNLNEFLSNKYRLGELIYGNSNDFENKDGLYTVVLDIDSNQILGFMRFNEGLYTNLSNNDIVNSLKDKFANNKIAVIWIEMIN